MNVVKSVQDKFKKREQTVLRLIHEYLGDVRVGVFGSYARGDYWGASDIDFCVITEERPPREITGMLRELADDLHADIVFVRPEYFEKSEEPFAKSLRRDWKEL